MKLDMMESVFFYCNSAQKAEEVLGITPKAHVYTWTGSHKPMIGLPGNYFVQYSYLTNGKSTPLGSSINDGMLATVNMLPTSGSSVSEWTLNEDYLNELLPGYRKTASAIYLTDFINGFLPPNLQNRLVKHVLLFLLSNGNYRLYSLSNAEVPQSANCLSFQNVYLSVRYIADAVFRYPGKRSFLRSAAGT